MKMLEVLFESIFFIMQTSMSASWLLHVVLTVSAQIQMEVIFAPVKMVIMEMD